MTRSVVIVIFIFFLTIHPCILYSYEDDQGGIDIHGFVSQGYMKTTHNEYMVEGTEKGTFQFNEFGINFSTNVRDSLRIGTQLMAFDLGHLGNNEILLDWGYADFSFREYIGVRAGLVKIPHGLYNTQRDLDMLRTTIFLPESVYGEFLRDAFSRLKGICLYGALPFGFYYQVLHGTATASVEGGITQTFADILDMEPKETKKKDDFIYNIQWVAPWDSAVINGFKAGASYYTARGFEINGVKSDFEVHIPFDTITAFTASLEVILGDFVVAAELMRGYIGVDVIIESDILKFPPQRTTTHSEGYYTSLSYRYSEWFEWGIYYSVSYQDKDDKSGKKTYRKGLSDYPSDGYLKNFCVACRFDINQNWILKLETHFMNGTLYVMGDPSDDKKEWWFNALKMTYSF